MATYTKTVDPNGGSNYASISAWEAGEQALYVSGDIAIADCKRTGVLKDTTAVTIAGWTVGVIPKIIVNAAHRHEGKWADQQAGGNYIYVMVVVASSSGIYSSVSGFELNGILCSSASGYYSIELTATALITNTIAKGGSYGFRVGANSNVVMWNCVTHGPSAGGVLTSDTTASLSAYNCTVIGNPSNYGVRNISGAVSLTNCYALGYPGYAYSGTITKTTCGSSDSTGSFGLQNIAYSTVNFVNITPGSENLHLVLGSGVIGVGTDLSGTFTTDIDDVTRVAPWDIGADQYVAAGGGTYTESLTDLITSQTSITDRQDYLETASVLIQSGVSAADLQTMLEAVLTLASSTTNVIDALVQPGSVSESLLVTATAVTLASDAQTFVEALTITAQAATSLSDLRLMLDNVSILCQSQVSASEIQNYLQSIIVTASATGSLTDILVGAFVGRYLAMEYATGRSFADLAQARSFAEQASARSFIEYASPRGRA